MKNLALSLLLGVLVSPRSEAQCSVTRDVRGSAVVYNARPEVLQEHNGPSSQPHYLLVAATTLYVSSSADGGMISLRIGTNAYRMDDVIPRSVRITFNDGSTLALRAREYEAYGSGRARMHMGVFDLAIPDAERFLRTSVYRVTAIDDRTGRTAEARPHPTLMGEQLACLFDRWERDDP